jgi:hypothetical protein
MEYSRALIDSAPSAMLRKWSSHTGGPSHETTTTGET